MPLNATASRMRWQLASTPVDVGKTRPGVSAPATRRTIGSSKRITVKGARGVEQGSRAEAQTGEVRRPPWPLTVLPGWEAGGPWAR
eukprot:6469043-Lingulodinium_polyedra.AAC.1